MNTSDSFQYSSSNDGSVSSFFGSDASGAALADANAVSGISFTASGYIDVLKPGQYTFSLSGDDWAGLTLDGSSIGSVTWWGGAPSFVENLTAGYHPFELSYVADGTPNRLSYSLTGPDGAASDFQYVTQVVAGVPEPATWGLMLLGLGLMGASLRARRGAVALA